MQALSDRTFSGKIRLKDQSDIASVERETWIYDDDGLVLEWNGDSMGLGRNMILVCDNRGLGEG